MNLSLFILNYNTFITQAEDAINNNNKKCPLLADGISLVVMKYCEVIYWRFGTIQVCSKVIDMKIYN